MAKRRELPDEFVQRYPWQTEESERWPPDNDDDDIPMTDEELDDDIRNNSGPHKVRRIIREWCRRSRARAVQTDKEMAEVAAAAAAAAAAAGSASGTAVVKRDDPLVGEQFDRIIVTGKVLTGYEVLCAVCLETEIVHPRPKVSWAANLARVGRKKCERV